MGAISACTAILRLRLAILSPDRYKPIEKPSTIYMAPRYHQWIEWFYYGVVNGTGNELEVI